MMTTSCGAHLCGTEIRFFLMTKDQDNKRHISENAEKCFPGFIHGISYTQSMNTGLPQLEFIVTVSLH